jgi:hypothetical protein
MRSHGTRDLLIARRGPSWRHAFPMRRPLPRRLRCMRSSVGSWARVRCDPAYLPHMILNDFLTRIILAFLQRPSASPGFFVFCCTPLSHLYCCRSCASRGQYVGPTVYAVEGYKKSSLYFAYDVCSSIQIMKISNCNRMRLGFKIFYLQNQGS